MNSAETVPPARRAGLDPVTEILKNGRTIAVVGLSSKPYRPSRGVAEYMQSAGYRIIPVNPMETEVLGEKSYARLEDIPFHIDIVNVFRRSEFVPEIVKSAIAVGAHAVLDAGRRAPRRSGRVGPAGGHAGGDGLLHHEGTREAVPHRPALSGTDTPARAPFEASLRSALIPRATGRKAPVAPASRRRLQAPTTRRAPPVVRREV